MSKGSERKRKEKRDTWIVLCFAAVAVLVVLIMLIVIIGGSQPPQPAVQTAGSTAAELQDPDTAPSYDIPGYTAVAGAELGQFHDSLSLISVGRYTGAYVEDGSDEEITDVAAIVVQNTGAERIEYCVIKLPYGEESLYFNVSALPAGASALVMEAGRSIYSEHMVFSAAQCLQFALPTAEQRVEFGDSFRLNAMDGVINITNLTNQDFTAPVKVFYKTELEYNLFLGGIAYSVTAQNGVPAGETVQILSSHYQAGESQILYMTYES